MIKKSKKNPKILLGLCEVAGYFSHLKRALDFSDYRAETSFITEHPFGYDDNHDKSILQKILLLNSKLSAPKYPLPLRLLSLVIRRFVLLPFFFIESACRYDVFVFGFRKTFLPFCLDVPMLKLLGKKVIFIFFGSDSRPCYLDGSLTGYSLKKRYLRTWVIKRELRRIDRYADYIVNAPATSILHERPFINWFHIGIPQVRDGTATLKKSANMTILHCPSNLAAKGTLCVRRSIDLVKKQGYEIDYIELSGKTNSDVQEAIGGCDFVIDQLYSDTPLAVFATEAAYYGKPAIVGGYEIKKVVATIDEEDRPPSYDIYPSEEALVAAIIDLIDHPELRVELGQRAKDFVHSRWSGEAVAKRFVTMITDDVPLEWYLDPYDMDYIYGCCICLDARNKLVHDYVKKFGQSALFLSDKPQLKAKLLDGIE